MGQTGTKAGQHRPAKSGSQAKPRVQATLRQSHVGEQPFRLPKRLIGTKSTGQVTIKGKVCNCLLDTGSQVTTVTKFYYDQYLSEQQIEPLHDLLEVEGANGQLVPYLGYVEIGITFPKEFLGAELEVKTLALVVPDTGTLTKSCVLIGTNTLDVVYEMYTEANPEGYQPIPHGYRNVLKILELRQKRCSDKTVGLVRMRGKDRVIAPAGETVVLEGTVSIKGFYTERSALLEYPSVSSLPGGLLVQTCLVDLPNNQSCKLPVVVSNESEHDITIPAKSVIAELCAIQTVLSHKQSVSESSGCEPSKASSVTFDFADSPIPSDWKAHITQKLSSMPEVFAQTDLDFGRTDKVQHHIKLSDETPFKHRARPIHPHDIEAVRQHLQELLTTGVIRESESPFSSPIVVVRKKNGQVRLCVDYRKLNLQTVKDAYALPRLDDTFTALSGSKWFSTLDLKSGYYQIEVAESDKPKTAFVCPLGFWEFNRMPQGVTNAPSTFQRLMERCMGDINLKEVVVFLDDLIVFSKTLQEHEARLMKVLERLKEYGLKLSPEKCKFFQSSVRYLGHVVSQHGVETDPEKTATLKTWPVPQNLKELRSFLGFCGYYRRFVKGYSSIVKPLNDLTSGYPPLRKHCKSKERGNLYHDPKEPFHGRWTPACQQAFEAIIDKLTSPPVLAFADPKLPYILHTDASTTGLGAALYQEQEGQLRVIAYASRGLSGSESRYPAHKLEFLALKWAVTEKLSDYLYGNQFTVVTDSNPLTYILTSAKLDATSYRWLAALSTFNFRLQYRSGKQNGDADGLSRRPHGKLPDDLTSQKERDRICQFAKQHLSDPDNTDSIDPEVVHAICERQFVYHLTPSEALGDDAGIALVESLAISGDAIPDSFGQAETLGGLDIVPHLSQADLRDSQRSDRCIRYIITQMESGEKPSPTLRKELPEVALLLRELNRFELRDGILYRARQEGGNKHYQLVLPEDLRESVLTSLHDNMGHMGIERTLDLVRARFYWPRMSSDVETKIKTCNRCVCRKTLPEKAAPLVNIVTTRALELVCMDFLSIEPDSSNVKDVLVITDHFTKYAVAIPTSNQKARTVAKCLWDHFIVHYGIPEKLHSDQGPDFESQLIKGLCEVAGIQKIRTTPYHPRGNPVERFNRTLLNMLGTLENKDKLHWKDFVKPLVHAYNCTKNEVTGFTPYELMFGRQPRLPVDLAFGLPVREQQTKSHSQYVKDLKSHLEESYKIATRSAAKVAERNKTRFDKHVTASTLDIGDRVLVRNIRIRGKHKLADKWEQTIYVVVKRAGDLPVYTIKPESRDGPIRTLHRDLLLPCGFLSAAKEVKPEQPRPKKRPRTRQNPHKDNKKADHSSDEDDIVPVNWFADKSVSDDSTLLVRRDVLSRHKPSLGQDDVTADHDKLADNTLAGADTMSDVVPTSHADHNQSYDNQIASYGDASCEKDLPETEKDLPGNDEPEKERDLFSMDRPDMRDEQILLPSDMLGSDEEGEDLIFEREIVNKGKDEQTNRGIAVRRSERGRQPPKRLDYPELGNPLVTVVKSLFQGLSTAFIDSLNAKAELLLLDEAV